MNSGWEIVKYLNSRGYPDFPTPWDDKKVDQLNARLKTTATTEDFLNSWLAGTSGYEFRENQNTNNLSPSILDFRYRNKNNPDLLYYVSIYQEDQNELIGDSSKSTKTSYNIYYFVTGLPSTIFDNSRDPAFNRGQTPK